MTMGPRCYIDDCGRGATLILRHTKPDPVLLCDEHRWIWEGPVLGRAARARRREAGEAAAGAGVPDAVSLDEVSLDHGDGSVYLLALGLHEAARRDPVFPRPVVTEPEALYRRGELRRWFDARRHPSSAPLAELEPSVVGPPPGGEPGVVLVEAKASPQRWQQARVVLVDDGALAEAHEWLLARAEPPTRRRQVRRLIAPAVGCLGGAGVYVSGAVPLWATPWFVLAVVAAAVAAGRLQARWRRAGRELLSCPAGCGKTTGELGES